MKDQSEKLCIHKVVLCVLLVSVTALYNICYPVLIFIFVLSMFLLNAVLFIYQDPSVLTWISKSVYMVSSVTQSEPISFQSSEQKLPFKQYLMYPILLKFHL